MKPISLSAPGSAALALLIVAACSDNQDSNNASTNTSANNQTSSSSNTTGNTTGMGTGTNTISTNTISTATSTNTSTTGAGGATSTTGVGGGTSSSMGGASSTGGGASTGGTGGGGCATLAGAIDRGNGSYVLEFGDTYFAAVPAGGKVMEFRRVSGSNLFTGPEVESTNFGSTLWTSPQSDWDWPPPTALDSDPYMVTVDEAAGSITMVSMGTPSVGPNVTVTKVFTANLCAEAVDISYSITNNAAQAVTYSAWEVSRVASGGLTWFAGEETPLEGDGKPLLMTSYMTDTHWHDNATAEVDGSKFWGEGTRGFVAYTQGTDLFLKSWTDVPAPHGMGHGEVEIYDGAGYVEIEVQGNHGSVAAGAAATLDMRWRVRPMPSGAQRVAGDAGLIAAVDALLAE